MSSLQIALADSDPTEVSGVHVVAGPHEGGDGADGEVVELLFGEVSLLFFLFLLLGYFGRLALLRTNPEKFTNLDVRMLLEPHQLQVVLQHRQRSEDAVFDGDICDAVDDLHDRQSEEDHHGQERGVWRVLRHHIACAFPIEKLPYPIL